MPKIQSLIHAIKQSIKLSTPSAVILGAIIISISHITYAFIISGTSPSQESAYFSGRNIDQSDFVEGNEKEGVYVVEYSDPECPFCITYYPTLKRVRDEYKSKVAFVYRHFPLTEIHPNAFDESKAILCAGRVGGYAKYFEYMDKLYSYKAGSNQTTLPKNGISDIAKGVGVDFAQFEACMKNEKSSEEINASMGDGVQAGVEGTPTSFVLKKTRKGYEIIAVIVGARPYEYTKAAIEQALSK